MKINTNQLIQCAFFPNEAKYKKTGYYKSSERRSMIRSLVNSILRERKVRPSFQDITHHFTTLLFVCFYDLVKQCQDTFV